MKKLFHPIIELLTYDLKRLIVIEVIIKLIGFFIIFPILGLVFIYL